MPDFLALGECMVEIGPVENGKCRRGFAGDTFNTAWYARRLLPESWTVGYGSCIGSDAISEEMAAYMESHGIDTSAMRRLADRTVGLYMISLQDGERSFSYWRGQSAARAMAEDSGCVFHNISAVLDRAPAGGHLDRRRGPSRRGSAMILALLLACATQEAPLPTPPPTTRAI